MTEDITFGWKKTEIEDGHEVRKEVELTFDKHVAERELRRVAVERLDTASPKSRQQRLKERAKKVVIERHYYDPESGEYVSFDEVEGCGCK